MFLHLQVHDHRLVREAERMERLETRILRRLTRPLELAAIRLLCNYYYVVIIPTKLGA